MILAIIKYHRTDAGEALSSEKIEKETEQECYRDALKKAALYSSNYYADSTVRDFNVMIVNPRTGAIIKTEIYYTPDSDSPSQAE